MIMADGTVLTKCDQCRDYYAGLKESQETPCGTCKVDLLPENEDAAIIYMQARHQLVTRHNGRYDEIIDISLPAVKVVMDLHHIKDQSECLGKVQRLFHHFLKEEREREREQAE